MTLQQASIDFKTADHEYQLAWANGDKGLLAAATKARTKAYNKVAKLVKKQLAR